MSQHEQFIVISTRSRWHTCRSRWIMGRVEVTTCPVTTALNRLTSRVKRLFLWYLAAFCQRCQAFCTFRVRHIEDVKMSDEPIASRPAFDLHSYWEEAREHLEERVPPFALTLHIAPTARARIQGDFTVLREEPD